MKQDHPIRIDRRRKAQSAGGRWAGLDGHAKGRVLLRRVADPAYQAAALVARIQELQRLSDGSWSDFAVLARQRELLAPIRALCEHRQIPVNLPGDLPALHRIREIGAFLAALTQHEREPLTAELLTALLPRHASPWRDLLASLIDDWTAEAGAAAVPATEIAEFCWETLAEQRRERSIGSGVLLSTLHGAKGLEFPHVLIVDGGWGRNFADEDERRLFYVGMTRARETLTLLELATGNHPHLPLLNGDWLLRAEPAVEPPPAEVLARRYTRLTPADLDLGYAGRQAPDAPIHGQLAALNSGDLLTLRRDGDHLMLLDAYGVRVARLSKRAASVWCPRIDMIETIRVDALLRRDRVQDSEAFAAQSRCEHWEVPLVEIRWRAQ
jgi:ATP-dependent DNA helicase RecQ